LRERGEDVLLLARHFVRQYGQRYNVAVKGLSSEAERYLAAQPWKGNVRELQHTVERAVVLARHEMLEPSDFAFESSGPPRDATGGTLEEVLDRRTKEYVTEVLDRTGWGKKQAATVLGIDRVTLYRLLKKFSLDAKAE
jgi:DNA-binding NtrC family response regulator